MTGGLGSCVSKADVLANTPEDLMYLSGTRKLFFFDVSLFAYNDAAYCRRAHRGPETHQR